MSEISHHFVSGSDFSGLFSSGSQPVAGLHLMNDGGVQVFMSTPPLSCSDEEITDWNDACNVTDFLLYALDNPVWISQWYLDQRELLDATIEQSKALERERLKASFTLIQGGKPDTEQE